MDIFMSYVTLNLYIYDKLNIVTAYIPLIVDENLHMDTFLSFYCLLNKAVSGVFWALI